MKSIVSFKRALGIKLFEFPKNRDTGYKEDIAESIRKYGFNCPIQIVRTNLVDGTMKLYIIDGHNRAKTAEFLDIEYKGYIIDNKFDTLDEIVKYMAIINNSQTPWTVNDYVKVYAKVGFEHYQNLVKVKTDWPYSFYTLAMLLSNKPGGVTDALTSGSFKIMRYNDAMKTLKFSGELGNNRKLSNRMLISLDKVMMLPKFDRDIFKAEYEKHCHKLSELRLDNFDDLFQSWLK